MNSKKRWMAASFAIVLAVAACQDDGDDGGDDATPEPTPIVTEAPAPADDTPEPVATEAA